MRTSTALAREPIRALLPVPDRCVLCGDARLALRYPARGEMVPLDAGAWRCTSFGHRHHPPIYGCEDCGLLFQWPMPSAESLETAYAGVVDPLYMAERDNRILTFRNVIRTLGPAGGRRLLDVGAYCGYFLEVARERGFRAEGLELSRWAAEHARAQGFTVHTEPLEVRAGSADRYHVLTLWDVVEHLPDPREELAAARDLLVPGGRLYLSTIDTGSLVARLLGSRWPWLMDMHLVYFDRPTISALLEEAGFRVLEIGTYSHTVSSGYLLRKVGASFPALAPLAHALSRVVPTAWPIPVNLGDNMLVSAERICAMEKPPRRALAALVAVSLGLTALVPLTNTTPYGDLSAGYTDHLHHAHATWVFLHRGLDAYRLPLAESSRGVAYPHETGAWPQMSVNYPPGMFAIFLPTALLGRWLPMSQETFGRVGVLWMLVLAHLAMLAIFLLLAELPSGGRAVVGMIAWVYLVRLALQGFYDPAFIGAGAMAMRAVHRRRPGPALLWLACSGALHYRAVALVPLGVAALWQALQAPREERPRWAMAVVAVTGVVVVGTFLLQWPATKRYLDTLHPSLGVIAGGPRFWAVVVASAAAAAASWWYAGPLVAGLVLAGLGLALTDIYDWWHGAVLLFAPMAVGVLGARAASTARAVLVGWLLLMQPLGFDQTPSDLFLDFAKHYRARP